MNDYEQKIEQKRERYAARAPDYPEYNGHNETCPHAEGCNERTRT